MICNNELCFIHVPKAAGMSLSSFLLNNLIDRPVYYFVPDGHVSKAEKSIDGVVIQNGLRHENLLQAQDYLSEIGKKLEDFEVILTVIRNPYDLEVSRFKYLQRGYPYDKGQAQRIAMENDFSKFAKESLFFARKTAEFEHYYSLNGEMLRNMKILRFEDLDNEIALHLKDYVRDAETLKKKNATVRQGYHEYISADVEEAIYRKYQWVFDQGFYARETF